MRYDVDLYCQAKNTQIKLAILWAVLFVVIYGMQDYRLAKVLHFVGFISWFAGLFYLPRLMVYGVETDCKNTQKTLNTMAYKLYYYIMNPAKNVVFISGITMSHVKFGGDVALVPLWLHIKGGFVVCLFGFHYYLNHLRQNLVVNDGVKSGRFYRIVNEIPTVLLLGIMVMVVYRFV